MENSYGSNVDKAGKSPATMRKNLIKEYDNAIKNDYLPDVDYDLKVGKNTVNINKSDNDSDLELTDKFRRIANSFEDKSYSLVDNRGYSKREQIKGREVNITIH